MTITALRALTAYKALAGVGVWLAPGTTSRIFGFEHERERNFLMRLSEAREAALAAGAHAARGEARRLWLRLSLACDVLDVVAGAAAVRGAYFTRSQAAGLELFSGLSALLTVLALAERRQARA